MFVLVFGRFFFYAYPNTRVGAGLFIYLHLGSLGGIKVDVGKLGLIHWSVTDKRFVFRQVSKCSGRL